MVSEPVQAPEFKIKRLSTSYVASWGSFVVQGQTKDSALRGLALMLVQADEHYLDHYMPPMLRDAFKTVAEDHADAYAAKAADYRAKVERVMAQGKRKRAASC
jgi:hypothetical protein